MIRVARYARYSGDNQNIASIEDQFRICREHAERELWKVVGTYHDAAISGASVILRPGAQALLQDAQRGKFEVVLAEALDRVSRDQADVAPERCLKISTAILSACRCLSKDDISNSIRALAQRLENLR
jgi:DNA invertase Pin-like site-specific DNA recombinase